MSKRKPLSLMLQLVKFYEVVARESLGLLEDSGHIRSHRIREKDRCPTYGIQEVIEYGRK